MKTTITKVYERSPAGLFELLPARRGCGWSGGIALDLFGHWSEQKSWLDRPGWGAKFSEGHKALLRRVIAIVIAVPGALDRVPRAPADGWVTRAWVCESEEDLAALVADLRAQGFIAHAESTNAFDACFEAHHLDKREHLAAVRAMNL